MVKKALEPYSHLMLNYEHITNDIDPAIVRKKSREFYAKLVNIKCNTIESTDMCPNLHHMCTLSDMSVECAFRNQLCSGVEIKLKEFNFKAGLFLPADYLKTIKHEISQSLTLVNPSLVYISSWWELFPLTINKYQFNNQSISQSRQSVLCQSLFMGMVFLQTNCKN